jgi:60 kDa SS-A/Ro ribonucleoprotein
MDLLSTVRNHWGGTDCAVPIKFAYAHGLLYDAFIVYTDNETHGGQGHVNEWLKKYRDRFNSKAKLIVVAMTSTNFSINDPTDKYGLDVVGFDASTPQVINQFIRGEI